MRSAQRALLAFAFAFAALIVGVGAGAEERWHPAVGARFSILLSVAPKHISTPAEVVDLDLFDARASTVAELKGQGKRVICYLSAGSWENWRPDKGDFPPRVIGKPYDGWPGERWLDIRQIADLAPVMRARLDLCKAKGFDAADPDNVDVYAAKSGFPLTRADAITYVRFLAREAHLRGLAVGLKNVPELSSALLPNVDFAVTEDCFADHFCGDSENFIDAGKPVFAIEYTDNRIKFAAFCQQAANLGLSPLLKKRNLGVWEQRCPE